MKIEEVVQALIEAIGWGAPRIVIAERKWSPPGGRADYVFDTELRYPILSPYTWNPETQYWSLYVSLYGDGSWDFQAYLNDGEVTPSYYFTRFIESVEEEERGADWSMIVEFVKTRFLKFVDSFPFIRTSGDYKEEYPLVLLARCKEESLEHLFVEILKDSWYGSGYNSQVSLALAIGELRGLDAYSIYGRITRNLEAAANLK